MSMFHSATKYDPQAAQDAGAAAQEREAATRRAQRIEQRFAGHPELEQFRAVIFADWPEGEDHLEWVATAPVAEIVDWAQGIEQASQNEWDATGVDPSRAV